MPSKIQVQTIPTVLKLIQLKEELRFSHITTCFESTNILQVILQICSHYTCPWCFFLRDSVPWYLAEDLQLLCLHLPNGPWIFFNLLENLIPAWNFLTQFWVSKEYVVNWIFISNNVKDQRKITSIFFLTHYLNLPHLFTAFPVWIQFIIPGEN